MIATSRGTRVHLRPMREGDLSSAERASAVTFLEADWLSMRASEPAPQPRSAAGTARWIERMRYLLAMDPDGCWVALDGKDVIGFAISQNRGALWYLATYGVLPEHQGMGVGRQLMDAVLAHAEARAGIFSSSVHPAATRRYRLAGFSLHPQMRMVGTVDRARLPAVTGLREGSMDDFAWMDRLDEDLRGAAHGSDHMYLLGTQRLVVTRSPKRRGYVYIDDQGRPSLLAAADPEIAQNLLWEALAASEGETLVNCITTANQWAVDVGLGAGLDIGQEGYIALRGMLEPTPYLPSGHFL